MTRPPNILIRVIFELHSRDKSRVTQIQDRISSFSLRPFPTLIEDSLSWLGRDRVLVFERVELEVGEVRVSRLEEDLAAGIARCLRRWAFTAKPSSSRALLPQPEERTGKEPHHPDDQAGEGSHQGLRRTKSGPRGLNAAIAAALEQPGEWPEFLSVLRDNHALRRRIADEVSPRLLRRLLGQLMQEQGPSIADVAETMIRLHERQPLIPVTLHVFRRELWECIFAELSVSPPHQITERSFILKVLQRWTGSNPGANRAFAARLSQSLSLQPPETAVEKFFSDAISDLKTDKPAIPAGSFASMNPNDRDASTASRKLRTLEMFLETGVLGWTLLGGNPESEVIELLRADPRGLGSLLGNLCEQESVRRRIATQFSETAKSRLLAVLAPTAASWMLVFMHQIRRVHAQKRLFAEPARQIASELWEFCFEYFAQHQKKTFDARSFLEHLLARTAERRNTTYHSLLSDLALRRGPELRDGITGTFESASFEQTLIALLDQNLFGTNEASSETSSSLIDPGFRACYSDLDVLAHWLRWQRLPRWSRVTDPEQTGRRLGSLLSGLPREIRAYANRAPGHGQSMLAGGGAVELPPAEQIKHWLAYGIWPDSVLAPDASQLSAWLERQSDADWLKALEGDSANETIVARLSHQASSGLFERVIQLLSGRAAGFVSEYLRVLDTAGRQIAPVASQVWANQVKKYALLYLLQTSSIAGRHAISIVDLARSTMVALSLNCRLSYERLVDQVELQSHGDKEIHNVSRLLRQELEREQPAASRSKTAVASSKEHPFRAPVIAPGQEIRPPTLGNQEQEEVQLPRVRTHDSHAVASSPDGLAWPVEMQEPELKDLTKNELPGPPGSDSTKRISALGDFLRTGRFPASAGSLIGPSASEWIAPCLSSNSQLALEMLKSAAAHAGALTRLMRYVEPSELEQIIHAAAPTYGGLLLLYIDAGAQVAAGASLPSAAHRSRKTAVHWEHTLAFLLAKDSTVHSAAGALRNLTVRVSRALAMSTDQYISALLSIARARKVQNIGYAALADMLEQMQSPAPPHTQRIGPAVAGTGEDAAMDSERREPIQQHTGALEPSRSSFAGPAEMRLPQDGSSADSVIASKQDETTSLDELAIGSPAPNDTLAQLDYLLRYGELAETAPSGGREELMTRVEEALEKGSIAYRAYILRCAGRELERERMARFLSSPLLIRVWSLLLPAHHVAAALCAELLEEATQSCSPSRSGPICREMVVEELFQAVANAQARRWDGASFLRSAVQRLSSHLLVREAVFVKHMRAVLERRQESARSLVQMFIDRIELEFAAMPPWRPAHEPRSDEQRLRPQYPSKPSRLLPQGEAFYISNAGLVLLWPFLQTYFLKLGLLDKNAFRDDQAQNRAIYLLQYLASGKWEAPEQDLLLNKVLTGWTVEQPLEFPARIAENEEALSLDLLRGVLKNWEKLKGTSLEGLRSSFLIREGSLMLKEADWCLTVSLKAYDMLLDSLPWRLGMIKLPWMKTLLRVKWR